jgi:hypothetical protein
VLFVLVSFLTRWLSLVLDVIDSDEAAHIVGAWEMLRGRVPYAEFVDNKPPLLYVYYALSQLLIGCGLRAVRLLTVAITVPLTALAVSACFEHSRTGMVAALTFLVYSAAFIGHDMLSVNTEILMLLPASWALVLMRSEAAASVPWRGALAGILVGLATLFRPQGVLFGPPLMLAALWVGRRSGEVGRSLRVAAAVAAGVLVPLAIAWGTLGWLHAADDFVYWVVSNNLRYVENPIPLREAAERSVSYLLPWLLVTGPLWWAAWRLVRRDGLTYHVALGVTLIACAVPATYAGFRFFPHYFIQVYVPLVFLAAPMLAEWCRVPFGPAGRRFIAWSLVMVAGFAVSTALLYSSHARVYREIDPVLARVAARLRADTCYGNGSLFIWGNAPVIYYHARMPTASRFVVLAPARLTGYISGNLASTRGDWRASGVVESRHWEWLLDDLARRRATFVVDTAPAGINRWGGYPLRAHPLGAYVSDHFVLVDSVEGIDIYRRRGCEGRSSILRPTGSWAISCHTSAAAK